LSPIIAYMKPKAPEGPKSLWALGYRSKGTKGP